MHRNSGGIFQESAEGELLSDTSKALPHFSPTEKPVGKGGEVMAGSRRPAALLVI